MAPHSFLRKKLKKKIIFYFDFKSRSCWFGGLFQDDDASHGSQHVGGSAFVVTENGVIVNVKLQRTVMIRIENLNIVAGMKRFIILDPNEIGTWFGHSGASHVDSATNKTVSFFGVIFEPTRFI